MDAAWTKSFTEIWGCDSREQGLSLPHWRSQPWPGHWLLKWALGFGSSHPAMRSPGHLSLLGLAPAAQPGGRKWAVLWTLPLEMSVLAGLRSPEWEFGGSLWSPRGELDFSWPFFVTLSTFPQNLQCQTLLSDFVSPRLSLHKARECWNCWRGVIHKDWATPTKETQGKIHSAYWGITNIWTGINTFNPHPFACQSAGNLGPQHFSLTTNRISPGSPFRTWYRTFPLSTAQSTRPFSNRLWALQVFISRFYGFMLPQSNKTEQMSSEDLHTMQGGK